jgi:hypothetical protein
MVIHSLEPEFVSTNAVWVWVCGINKQVLGLVPFVTNIVTSGFSPCLPILLDTWHLCILVSYVEIYIDMFPSFTELEHTYGKAGRFLHHLPLLGFFFLPLRSVLFPFNIQGKSSDIRACFRQFGTHLIISPWR